MRCVGLAVDIPSRESLYENEFSIIKPIDRPYIALPAGQGVHSVSRQARGELYLCGRAVRKEPVGPGVNSRGWTMAKAEPRGIQSIEVGERLLSVLVKASGPMMLRDLAFEADLAPAQAHAYLTSYRRAELVEQDTESGRYILGPAALRLGLARMKSIRPLQRTTGEAAHLSRSLGLMVAVIVWGPQAPTAIQVHEGTQSLNINIRPGTTFNVTGSSCGRIFGAYEKSARVEERVEAEFNGVSQSGIGRASSREQFAASLSAVRSYGYSGIADSPVPGLCSVSAPVFGEDSKLQLALSLIGSNEVLSPSATNSAVRELLSLTRGLSDDAKGGRVSRGDI